MSGKDGGSTPDLVEDALGYVTEYAKSNRSTCQVCKEKIQKGVVRLGVEVPNPYRDGATMPLWGHTTCVLARLKKPGKASSKKVPLNSVDDVQGYNDLKQEDQDALKELVEQHAGAMGTTPDDWTELIKGGQFWKIARVEALTHTSYGNSNNRDEALCMVKEHKDETAAEKYKEQMIKDKIKKGYHKLGEGGDEVIVEKEPDTKKKEEKTEEEAKKPAAVEEAKTEDTTTPDVYGFQCEYAKSNRSRCKGCNEKIDKGELRIATVIDNPFVARKDPDKPVKMPVWYHLECFWKNQRKGTTQKTRLGDCDDLEGFEALKQPDQKMLKDRVTKETEMLESFPTAPAAPASSSSTTVAPDQVYLEATSGEHNKWWGITQNAASTKTRWGDIGEEEEGHFVLKDFDNPEEATAYLKKMVTSKLGRSYELISVQGVKVEADERQNRAQEFVPEKKSPKKPKKPPAKKRKRT